EEKERRFSIMHSIFPSTVVASGKNIYKLTEEKHITPKWEDKTTLESYIEENRVGGIVVLQDDKIKLEVYGEGVNKNTLWTSYSVAKSISSLLVGVALKEGDISNLDDKLEKYIPELKGKDYGKVSVRQRSEERRVGQ